MVCFVCRQMCLFELLSERFLVPFSPSPLGNGGVNRSELRADTARLSLSLCRHCVLALLSQLYSVYFTHLPVK